LHTRNIPPFADAKIKVHATLKTELRQILPNKRNFIHSPTLTTNPLAQRNFKQLNKPEKCFIFACACEVY
jgi:hypothetical protein